MQRWLLNIMQEIKATMIFLSLFWETVFLNFTNRPTLHQTRVCGSISFKLTNRRQTEVWPQGTDDVVCVVRLIRVPDEANGDDLGGIHEDLSDPNPLATSALAGGKGQR